MSCLFLNWCLRLKIAQTHGICKSKHSYFSKAIWSFLSKIFYLVCYQIFLFRKITNVICNMSSSNQLGVYNIMQHNCSKLIDIGNVRVSSFHFPSIFINTVIVKATLSLSNFNLSHYHFFTSYEFQPVLHISSL